MILNIESQGIHKYFHIQYRLVGYAEKNLDNSFHSFHADYKYFFRIDSIEIHQFKFIRHVFAQHNYFVYNKIDYYLPKSKI